MKKVNQWNDDQLEDHLAERTDIWREQNNVNWTLYIDIITNSGFNLNNENFDPFTD